MRIHSNVPLTPHPSSLLTDLTGRPKIFMLFLFSSSRKKSVSSWSTQVRVSSPTSQQLVARRTWFFRISSNFVPSQFSSSVKSRHTVKIGNNLTFSRVQAYWPFKDHFDCVKLFCHVKSVDIHKYRPTIPWNSNPDHRMSDVVVLLLVRTTEKRKRMSMYAEERDRQ